MPLKNGRMTGSERSFVNHMARTGDATYSAAKAGYGTPAVRGSQLMGKPAIKDAVLQAAQKVLRDELLPLALAAHKQLLDKSTPHGARLGAVKLTYDRTLGADDAGASKEPSEMSYDELQESIGKLRQEADARAEGAKDITPDPGVFD